MKTDLILLHAPSVYDFRKKSILYGPVSDVVPSTHVFEMYPIGFVSILAYLEKHGYSVRVINIALKMLNDRLFDTEHLIKSLKPAAFGIDLHWMVHCHGSLEIASIIKKYHPGIPVIFGGLSSSFYHKELIKYSQVDYVLRGDCCEEPMRRLISAVKEKKPVTGISNLTWKDKDGIHINQISNVPDSLDDFSFDYRKILFSCVKHFDIFGHIPFKSWFKYPIVASLSCRGCAHNCVICGGSAFAYKNSCNRDSPAYRSPELLAKDIGTASKFLKAPNMILGDIFQPGREYADRFLNALKKEKIKNHIAFEFFIPPDRNFFEKVAGVVPNFNIQISPESHDVEVRRAFGRPYDNETLEKSIKDALECGCGRIDMFFMTGIPRQTQQSVRETVLYCEQLLKKYHDMGYNNKVHPYISPLAPFLDPGSLAFDNPGKYGYRLFYKTLEEHRAALLEPGWKWTLNYETIWMTRDEMVDITYEAALELNRIKHKYGLLNEKESQKISQRIEREKELLKAIEKIYQIPDVVERDIRIEDLMRDYKDRWAGTICPKDEMNWPSRFIRFNPAGILLGIWKGRKRG